MYYYDYDEGSKKWVPNYEDSIAIRDYTSDLDKNI